MGLVLAAVVAAPHQKLWAAGPPPVILGSTAQFTILAGATITTTGGGVINGNVGASPIAGSAIHLTQAQVNGIIYAVDATGPAGSVDDPTLLTKAKGDLTIAYGDAEGRTPVPSGPNLNPGSGNLAGLNLPPGLYKFTSTASISGGNLTLTGGPSDVWIFQCADDLEVGVSSQVILAGGAQAGNVFWQVGTSATMGTSSVMQGTILANQAITMNTSSTLVGRALAFTAGVTWNGTGAILPTPQNPTQGSLQVTIEPSNAVTAGALWQVDGGSNENSGVTLTNLSPGPHTISFTNVSGWVTPADQFVTITSSQITSNTGLYVLTGTPTGAVSVTILPVEAVMAGALWQVDSGSNEVTGATVTNLSVGSHIVSFTPVAGWTTPSNQIVEITSGATTTTGGLYALVSPMPGGALTVDLLPAGAVMAGARWKVDGGTNEATGATVTNLSVGSHIVSFTAIAGWITPADQIVSITNGQTTTSSGLYALAGTEPAGALRVTIRPIEAVIGGALWQVDGGTYENNGATVSNLSVGSHIVAFTPVAGWITPADQIVLITNDETTTSSGLYVPIASVVGALTVDLLPAGAVSAGAQWQLDGGIDQNSGATITNLAPGTYSVSFSTLFGWITPSSEIVMITNGATTTISGLYAATNSMLIAGGIYNGLFSMTNGVTEPTAGMLKSLTLAKTGIYSGTILTDGASHVIRGTFDAAGLATNAIARADSLGGPLTLVMKLNGNERALQVTGTVSGTDNGVPWVADLLADLATNTVAEGQFSVLLPPDTNNEPPTLSPGGDGYLLITNYTGTARDPAAATVRITGALADGTAFNQSVPASEEGYVPIYASLYGNKGLILGWINLDPANLTDVSLTWIHPERASGLYKGGFTNVLPYNQILISPWADPPESVNLLTALSVLNTTGDTNDLMNFTLTISPALDFDVGAKPKLVSGSINRQTGFFKVVINIGGIAPPGPVEIIPTGYGATGPTNDGPPTFSVGPNWPTLVGGTTLTGYGAILQNVNIGGGYFLTKTNAQAIKLVP